MSLTGLLDIVVQDPAVAEAVRAASEGRGTALDLVGPPALRPFVVAAIAARADRPVLAVTATTRECEDLVAALGSLLPEDSVVEYPSWETLPHERLSPRSDTVGRRLAVLRRLAHPTSGGLADSGTGRLKVVVAPVRSVLQPQVKGLGELEPVALVAGQEIELDTVVEQLAAAAYSRVDLVEKRGEFAVRGGILDVFPPTEEHPLRVEFWGDRVEEIRWFKVADQRSLETAEHGLWAPPCRELLLTDQVRERARELLVEHPGLVEMLGKIAEGIAVEGMESLAPALVDDMELLLDVLPAGSHVLVCDPERVRTRSGDLVATSREFLDASWAAAAGGGESPIDLGAASLRSLADVREHAREIGVPWWSLSPFSADADNDGTEIGAVEVEAYRGDAQRVLAEIKGRVADDWRVVLVTEGHGPAARFVETLSGEGVAARLDDDLPTAPETGLVHVTTGCIGHGFSSESLRTLVLTEQDVSGQRTSTKDMRRLPSRRRNMVDPLQLKPGDFVVHESHGVGRYVEMVQRTVQGAQREYLVLEYAPPSAANRATACSCPPTSWSRSPSTSAARARRCTASAAPTGPRPRPRRRRRSRRSPAT